MRRWLQATRMIVRGTLEFYEQAFSSCKRKPTVYSSFDAYIFFVSKRCSICLISGLIGWPVSVKTISGSAPLSARRARRIFLTCRALAIITGRSVANSVVFDGNFLFVNQPLMKLAAAE